MLQVFYLIGGLSLFLMGMKIMSDGIYQSAGDRIREMIHLLTRNRFSAVLTGLVTTSLVQSSSATTVMVVSLVNAQLITLAGAIGIIMGANIGTTLTAWIVSILGFKFKIAAFALPAIAISLPLHFSKRSKLRDVSAILFGFGLLFLGLGEMKDAVSVVKDNAHVLEFVSQFTNLGYLSLIIFVIFGTLLTVVVQSSSAAMAITITLAYNGWIPYEVSCAIVLGENIGTTITAFLASIEMSSNAKRAARAHMLFNVFGVFWMMILLYPVTSFIDAIVPGDPRSDFHVLPIHLSAFHTLFNMANTFALIWFIPAIEKIVIKLIPYVETEQGPYRIPFIHSNIPDSAEINIINAKAEVGKMSHIVYEMFERMMNLSAEEPSQLERSVENLEDKEKRTDDMQEQISNFLSDCLADNLTENQASTIAVQLRVVNELESIADSIYKISHLVLTKKKKGFSFHKNAWEEIHTYTFKVMDFLKYHADFLSSQLTDQNYSYAREMEKAINDERSKLYKKSQKKINKGADLKGELLYMEIVRQLEHIGDFCFNISEAIEKANAE